MKRFLILLSILPFFAFADSSLADGECRIVTYADGTYHIVCDGTGVIYDYVTITNRYAYEVRNCEYLRSELISIESELSSSIDSVEHSIDDIDYFYSYVYDGIKELKNDWLNPDLNLDNGTSEAMEFGYKLSDYADFQVEDVKNSIESAKLNISPLKSSVSRLQDITTNIVCCSSSSNDNQTCQSCDFSAILELLNESIFNFNKLTNDVSSVEKYIFDQLGGYSSLQYRYMSFSGAFGPPFYSRMRYFSSGDTLNPYINLLNLSLQNQFNTAVGLASVNNYLYDIRTNLIVLTTESTNFFSFFRGEVGVNGVLEDWQPQFGSYHDYLTNHYVKSVIDPSSLSSSEREKTNWFARVETLLASLVFADDSISTNTVDSSYGNDQVSQLTSGLESITQTSSSQLGVFQQTSESLVSRVRSFSSAFSDASMPSTVRLVKFDNSDSSFIQFESSEISPLVEACHCATTLAWCLGGLILLFWFIHYTVKASYNLVVFIYSVISSIFSK